MASVSALSSRQTSRSRPLSLGQQLLLTAALLGTESTIVFEQIYNYLSLQYFGVPTSLMSVNGIIGGLSAIIIIPLAGVFIDRSSSAKIRKIIVVLFGLGIMVTGYIVFITASVLKLLQQPLTGNHFNSSFLKVGGNTTFSTLSNGSGPGDVTPTSRNGTPTENVPDSLSASAILGIIGFTVIDTGYDVGNSMIRAYVLDHTPRDQHTTLLIKSTLMAAVAGTVMSFLGILDLPNILGDLFSVDGTATTFTLLVCLLCVVSVCCYSCTLLTGVSIARRANSNKSVSYKPTQQSTAGRAPSKIISRYSADSSETKPLMEDFEKADRRTGYLATSFVTSGDASERLGTSADGSRNVFEARNRVAPKTSNCIISDPAVVIHYKEDVPSCGPRQHRGPSPPVGRVCEPEPPFFSKRLVVLISATCFSISAMISFIMFIPNAVTLGICKGDPMASLGTAENESYKRGLRASSVGSFIFYCSYFLTCLVNNKIFQVIGERLHFLLCHVMLIATTTTLILLQDLHVYYVAMATFGPFRTCIFTLPFVLANNYTRTENSDPKKSRVGRVMALIGAILPANYIIVSSVMSPLIDLTGNVWLPLYWTCAGNVISILLFSVLFCV
ncbi:unnamed protein product [Lymnaea stagnalis]|uniref:Uncharacterized protein n=1 Tax=Lymnaea stagnalis TaxID=6523 RepID=A0AAV2HQY6_LYMST